MISSRMIRLVPALRRNLWPMSTMSKSHQAFPADEDETFDIEEKPQKMHFADRKPQLTEAARARVDSCLSALKAMGFSESISQSAIRRCPQLLQISSKKILKQYSFLKTYLTGAETRDLIGKSIDVFLTNENTLKTRLDYLIKSMSHETKNIVCCRALSYPLKHIKTRHEFLIRSGLFKPIKYEKLIKVLEKDYKDKNKQRDKYFKPLEVVCFTDVDFLKVCTNDMLTLNEYVAFEELFHAELEVIEEQEEQEENEEDDEFNEDDGSSVSLVQSTNSIGYMSDIEAKSCYF